MSGPSQRTLIPSVRTSDGTAFIFVVVRDTSANRDRVYLMSQWVADRESEPIDETEVNNNDLAEAILEGDSRIKSVRIEDIEGIQTAFVAVTPVWT